MRHFRVNCETGESAFVDFTKKEEKLLTDQRAAEAAQAHAAPPTLEERIAKVEARLGLK